MQSDLNSLRARLDASGFGIPAAPAPPPQVSSASAASELQQQEALEVAALAHVTNTALEAADALAGLNNFLVSQAGPATTTIREQLASTRETLQRLQGLESSSPT